MQIVTLRDRVLAFLAAVIVLAGVIAFIINQEQLKDDCRASGGLLTEVHDGSNTWVCSPPGATVPIIVHTGTPDIVHTGTNRYGRRR